MSGQTPYIGSKISLISKLDIRYEGILYTVDTNDSTIALAKVRSFGTENRPCSNPVAPRDDVYEYIIFKAADIKDLIVCETPKATALNAGLPYDPAILSVSGRSVPGSDSAPAMPGAPVGGTHISAGSSRSATPQNNRGGFGGMNNLPGGPPHGGNRGGFVPRGGNQGGGFRGNRGYHQQHRGGFNRNGNQSYGMPRPNPRGEKLKFDGDYDFEKANEKFKEEIIGKMEDLKLEGDDLEKPEDSPAKESNEPFYDKKNSFFDRISCEATEKAEGRTGRPDWKKERETNQETFGQQAVRSMNYRRGRGFGRGRGRGANRGYAGGIIESNPIYSPRRSEIYNEPEPEAVPEDPDTVSKNEWMALAETGELQVGHVRNILHSIQDQEWVTIVCGTTEVPNFPLQKSLIDYGTSLSSASIPVKIWIEHTARILAACHVDVKLYLTVRRKTCLELAIYLAETANFATLNRLLAQNMEVIGKYQLAILNAIPCCIPAENYEHLLPRTDSDKPMQIEEELNPYLDSLAILAEDNGEDAAGLVEEYNEGIREGNAEEIQKISQMSFVEWVKKRVVDIDVETGNSDLSIELLKLAVQLGFEELQDNIPRWELYADYVKFCRLINETYEGFMSEDPKIVVGNFMKMASFDLTENIERVVQIVEYKMQQKEEGNLTELMRPLLVETSEKSMKVLQEFCRIRPDAVNQEIILECLLNLMSNGVDLLTSLRDLPFEEKSEVSSALATFLHRNVKPTFKEVWESKTDRESARKLLIRMVRKSPCESAEEWEMLRDDVIRTANDFYNSLISTEEALIIVASELLDDERSAREPELMPLLLSLRKNDPKTSGVAKLGTIKSSELLLSKADQFLQQAVQKGDPLLGRARLLAFSAREIASKQSHQFDRLLEAVELAQELGCTALPVVIKHANPYELLEQIIDLESNFKQGKKCAKLGVLLAVSETPVATALSLCSLSAIKHGNYDYVTKYLNEIISKARGIQVVHQLCMKIMDSPYEPPEMDDIYACAVLNAPESELLLTMDKINEHRHARIQKLNDEENVPWNTRELELCGQIVLDENYTKVSAWTPPAREMPKSIKRRMKFIEDYSTEEKASLFAYHSATVAVGLAAFHSPEDTVPQFTINEKLSKYAEALKKYSDQLSTRLIENVNPQFLISQAFQSDTNISSLDRLIAYGCDRERFIEDAQYRNETIIGLAMSEEEQMFQDAIELAKSWKMDEWELHMASLENALTSLSISEAKAILKSRGHLAKLRTKVDQFHATLRKSVLPLLSGNEAFIAYCSLFAESEPEKKSLPTLKTIFEKDRNQSLQRLFQDPELLSKFIVSIPDKAIAALVAGLFQFPVSSFLYTGRDKIAVTSF
ncbi:hypothetical protein WR25_11878 isoform A [Diploscapter pachys]|uniref:Uncharacterized protein n=1 Tax=Diploscapter pachys TaxID=2018661 RepID=A0A2A2JAV3_9BILA|nr:hypothetical protein WR25_11878 isoform A [Diploscapter pachys]